MKKHYTVALIVAIALHACCAQGAASGMSPSEEYWRNVVEPTLEQNRALLVGKYLSYFHDEEEPSFAFSGRFNNQNNLEKTLTERLIEQNNEWLEIKDYIKGEAQYTDLNEDFIPEIRETLDTYTGLLIKEGKAKNFQEEQEEAESRRKDETKKWHEENRWRSNKTGWHEADDYDERLDRDYCEY